MGDEGSGRLSPIRVLIVDDHPLVRDGLKLLLMTAPDLTLAGEAGNGQEALRLCAAVPVDIVLMDLKMPGMDGIQATRAVCTAYPALKVIILTSFIEKGLVEEALQAGATSYILKECSSTELAAAIHGAMHGQTTISSAAAKSLVQTRQPEADELTNRERAVLSLLAEGLSNAEIGVRLAIKPTTVNFHVGNILSKLDVANRTEAVALAMHRGLID